MMFGLSKREIKLGYKGVKRLAQKAFAEGDFETSLEYVENCAIIAQQFNWIYTDDELEDLLAAIGAAIIPKEELDYSPVSGRVVLYDDFCTSFILALQYLDALISSGKEVLYVTSRNVSGQSKFSNIIELVNTRPNVKVHVVPQGNVIQRSINIYETIVGFRPEKLLLHIKADSISIPGLFRLPQQIQRYLINLADQTFWLGKKAIDYCIEFRQFGVSVSQQRRGIKPEQQLLIPFYPIVDGNAFEGFPNECTSDKVVIFSGGDLYKVIDEKKTYWKLVKWILDSYPQVVFLFATKVTPSSTDFIDQFVKENRFQGRFIHINYRKDINEVFLHCDIYMGTCPVSGSLMSQLAAVNAKPILQYYYPGTPDDETEQAICINEVFQISFYDEKHFMTEVERLIMDKDYRKAQGERLKNAIITKSQFDKMVSKALCENKSQFVLRPYSIDYTSLDERWFALEKLGVTNTMPYICGILGNRMCFRFAPILFVKKIMNKIGKYA